MAAGGRLTRVRHGADHHLRLGGCRPALVGAVVRPDAAHPRARPHRVLLAANHASRSNRHLRAGRRRRGRDRPGGGNRRRRVRLGRQPARRHRERGRPRYQPGPANHPGVRVRAGRPRRPRPGLRQREPLGGQLRPAAGRPGRTRRRSTRDSGRASPMPSRRQGRRVGGGPVPRAERLVARIDTGANQIGNDPDTPPRPGWTSPRWGEVWWPRTTDVTDRHRHRNVVKGSRSQSSDRQIRAGAVWGQHKADG